MELRQLGRGGAWVSAVGLGCFPMSGGYGRAHDKDAIAAIHCALDLGITLLDTADVYGLGHNEELVGRAIRGRRGDVFVATKFGNVRDPQGRQLGIDGRREYVRAACDASLRRLGVDTIDLYQQHRVDPDTPIEETVGAMAELVQEGKVRYLGLSEALVPDLRRAAATHQLCTLQSEYSLLERGVEQEVLGACDELGIGFLPFSPLVRGLLAGSLTADAQLEDSDFRRGDRFPRVGPEHRASNARLASTVRRIADERGATASQVALAWLLSRRPSIVPIPGTKRREYVRENAAAPELRLTPDEQRRLDALSAQVQGARYGRAAEQPNWTSPARASDAHR